MGIGSILALGVLMSVAGSCAGQSSSSGCPTDPTCDTTNSQCLGFGDLSVNCANGTAISHGTCYQPEICASASANQGNDWIKITADNVNPRQCYAYSQSIKQNMVAAYNTWCCQSNNFLKCCPNSIGWPTGVAKSAANCMAMQDATTEVAYTAAWGSAAQTQFFLQLRPRSDSTLCRLLVYNTAAASAAGGSATVEPAAATTGANTSSISTTTASSTVSSAAATTVSSISDSSRATSRAIKRRKRQEESHDLSTGYETVFASEGEVTNNLDRSYAAEQYQRRQERSASVVVTLDAATIRAMITDVNVPNLVVTAVATASNGTVTVRVTAVQNVASASSITPDRPSYGWIIATGAIVGLIAALLVAYLIACAIHRSKNSDSRLPL